MREEGLEGPGPGDVGRTNVMLLLSSWEIQRIEACLPGARGVGGGREGGGQGQRGGGSQVVCARPRQLPHGGSVEETVLVNVPKHLRNTDQVSDHQVSPFAAAATRPDPTCGPRTARQGWGSAAAAVGVHGGLAVQCKCMVHAAAQRCGCGCVRKGSRGRARRRALKGQ